MLRRLACVVVAVALPLASGCQALRLHAKDLLYHPSAAVHVPAWTATALFVAPPVIAWLPVSIPVLALVQDETAIWFALAPGILVGGPLLFLLVTPLRLIVGPPDEAPEEAPRAPEPASRPATAPAGGGR